MKQSWEYASAAEEIAALRARIAELEAEQEGLLDVIERVGIDLTLSQDRIAELEARPEHV